MPLASWSVPLALPPDIVYSGVGRHGGAERSHFYKLDELWALHIYNYDGLLETQGRAYPVQKGSISLIRPGIGFQHSWFCPESVHVYYLFKLTEPSTEWGTIPVIQNLHPASPGYFEFQADAATRFMRERARATARLWEFLFSITIPERNLSLQIPDPVRKALNEMERNLHQKIRASELARSVGLSHNQLCRLFRKHMGKTVLEYLADLRWKRVLRLLTNTQIPSKQIAYDFGFSDLSHFNKFVRMQGGLSPRALRAQKSPLSATTSPTAAEFAALG